MVEWRERKPTSCSHFDSRYQRNGAEATALCADTTWLRLEVLSSLASHFRYDWLIHEHNFEMKKTKKRLTHYYGRQWLYHLLWCKQYVSYLNCTTYASFKLCTSINVRYVFLWVCAFSKNWTCDYETSEECVRPLRWRMTSLISTDDTTKSPHWSLSLNHCHSDELFRGQEK